MASIISAGTTSGTSLNLSGDTSGVLQLASNGSTTALTIDTSQNVGIGTSSPLGKLEVRGSGNTALYLHTGNNSGDNSLIYFGDTGSATVGLLAYDHGTNAMTFHTNSAERMRIDSSGNVGIGRTPDQRLQIAAPTAVEYDMFVGSTRTLTLYADATQTIIANPTAVPMIFRTSDTERMRITSGGNVLINSTSGTLPLSVQGTNGGAAAGMFTGAAAGVGNDLIYFYSSGQASLIGYIGYNGTLVTYNTTSDYRLKDNIVPMTGALAKVAQLKPVTYTWKLNNANGQGFIAHELAEVFPDAVSGEKDGMFKDGKIKPQGIDTSILVATLAAAIQELKAELDATKAEVQALKGVA